MEDEEEIAVISDNRSAHSDERGWAWTLTKLLLRPERHPWEPLAAAHTRDVLILLGFFFIIFLWLSVSGCGHTSLASNASSNDIPADLHLPTNVVNLSESWGTTRLLSGQAPFDIELIYAGTPKKSLNWTLDDGGMLSASRQHAKFTLLDKSRSPIFKEHYLSNLTLTVEVNGGLTGAQLDTLSIGTKHGKAIQDPNNKHHFTYNNFPLEPLDHSIIYITVAESPADLENVKLRFKLRGFSLDLIQQYLRQPIQEALNLLTPVLSERRHHSPLTAEEDETFVSKLNELTLAQTAIKNHPQLRALTSTEQDKLTKLHTTLTHIYEFAKGSNYNHTLMLSDLGNDALGRTHSLKQMMGKAKQRGVVASNGINKLANLPSDKCPHLALNEWTKFALTKQSFTPIESPASLKEYRDIQTFVSDVLDGQQAHLPVDALQQTERCTLKVKNHTHKKTRERYHYYDHAKSQIPGANDPRWIAR